ncbi:Peroxidase 10, partial [Mucuna pruriens]
MLLPVVGFQGFHGPVLLDDTGSFKGEKNGLPNRNSIRGFELIDTVMYEIECACPSTVSCADILALAAREAVNLSIGPYWRPALLGRRDGTTASESEANKLPSPFESIQNIANKFISKGLEIKDVVVLSGLLPSLISFYHFGVLNFSAGNLLPLKSRESTFCTSQR